MRIAIIGAGNVATHLALALSAKAEIVQVLARTSESARRLADLLPGAVDAIIDDSELVADADLYLISVNDEAIADIVNSTPEFPGIWAHTSGSIGAEIFEGKKSRFGVFYPLQTFSREMPVNMKEVPMFIEGSSSEVEKQLCDLARKIACPVEIAGSQRRKSLHVAAVFACNFANLMWLEADRLLAENGLSITAFSPLLEATLEKLKTLSPKDAMTGPGRRGDLAVINDHLSRLPEELRPMYAMLSRRILEIYHPDKVSAITYE